MFDINTLKQLRAEGLTIMQMADRVGSNYETVRQFCHLHKVIGHRNIAQRWGSEDYEYFKSLWLGTTKRDKIAELVDLSIPSVKRLAKKLGLPSKYSKKHPVRESKIEQSIERYKAGKSTKEIGIELALDDETVRGYINRYAPDIMRTSRGTCKQYYKLQNVVIRELYLAGVEYAQISKKAKLGSHGIEKRLAYMNLKRRGNPEYRIWWTLVPKSTFRIFQIYKGFEKLNITVDDYDQYLYQVYYYSEVLEKWRKFHKGVEFTELRATIVNLIKSRKSRLGNHFVPEFKIGKRIKPECLEVRFNKSIRLKLGVDVPGEKRVKLETGGEE